MNEEIMQRYNLPELPEPAEDDDPEARNLVLFRQNDSRIVLTDDNGVSYADSVEYCERDDTKGSGWFVGHQRIR